MCLATRRNNFQNYYVSLQETFHALLNDYSMTIHEYATSLEVDFNPPEIIAIYAMA